MITVEDLISFGHFRKQFAEMKKSAELVTLYSKSDITNIAKYRMQNEDTPFKDTQQILNQENAQMKQEIVENVMGVIQLTVDALNERGATMEEVKEKFKS
jgi:hypothetical protein